MNRHMRAVTLQHVTGETQDAYGAFTSTTVQLPIEMAINTIQGSKQEHSNVLTVDSTHIGITKYANISVNDEILVDGNTYTITYIIAGGRYTQVFLKLVV